MVTPTPSFLPADRSPVILTGATGFLGSHLLAALLAQGRPVVVLGRRSADAALAERLAILLRWFGLENRPLPLHALEAELAQPRCGLDEATFSRLARSAAAIVHCASDTSFAAARRERVFAANVDGLRGVLDLAAAAGGVPLHHVSTAYAAMPRDGLVREELAAGGAFTNVYEESKAAAEHCVSDFCSQRGLPFSILRPSIVYGDSRTGRTLRFDALYKFVQALHYVRDLCRHDRRHGGRLAGLAGATLRSDGTLHLPLRVHLPAEGLINLIPVDHFVAAVLAVLDCPATGAICHITTDDPPTLGTLAQFCSRFLGLSGIEIHYAATAPAPRRTVHQALIERLVGPYRPYLSDRRCFARDHLRRVAPALIPPSLDYARFERCMRFAVATNWGENLFSSGTVRPR